MSEEAPSTPGGIPAAEFIESVDDFLSKNGLNHDQALNRLQDLYSKYKFIETRLSQSKANLKGKMPEIRKTLEAMQFLREKSESGEPYSTHFELAANVLAKADVEKIDTVCLWLGANVMMEFTFDEAEELLKKNLESAGRSLERVQQQVDFLRDQITTTEVNVARVYNHEVRTRQGRGGAAPPGGAGAVR